MFEILLTSILKIWSSAKNSNLKKIQVFQTRILSLIPNSPHYIKLYPMIRTTNENCRK